MVLPIRPLDHHSTIAEKSNTMDLRYVEGELLRPIEGFPDYWVSSDGRVWSDRLWRGTRGRWLKSRAQPAGHCQVTLCGPDGRAVTKYLHRLVAEAYAGPQPAPGMEVCHNNGNPADNRAENLRWDTRKGNLADKVAHGTTNRGVAHYRARTTENEVRAIRAAYSTGRITLAELGEQYGITQSTVHNIVKRKTWGHLND